MEEKFQKLTDREHILIRPSMYIGKTVPEETTRFILGSKKTVTIVPGLMKIVNELIDNSIDEFIRSEGKAATKIQITVENDRITVNDNGRGIPVERYNGAWRPEVAWTEAKAGTSFAENRVGPGANGVGSVVANVFSKEFHGQTNDGKQFCTVDCSNNMEYIKTKVQKSRSVKTGTSVTILPDYARFGVTGFTEDHLTVLHDRIHMLAITYPEITFIFNGDQIRYKKSSDYFSMYGDVYIPWAGPHYVAAVFPSSGDEYEQKSSIDGLDMLLGGTHEAIIVRDISYALRDIIHKKHKLDMSPAEIKRGLRLVFIGRNFPNMEFDSQTKERLTNSEKVVREWLSPFDNVKIAKKIFECKEIIDPIIEAKLAKQLAAEKRAVTIALKKQAKKHVEKHLAAKSNNPDDKILLLCEGDSAASGAQKVRDPKKHGLFPLRGMPMNTYGASEKDMLANAEISNIMAITGLKFGMHGMVLEQSLEYGRIGLMCDSDHDGNSIVSMLINFFYHWPDLFTQKRIFIVPSPRYVLTKGKGKNRKVVYFYDTTEYETNRIKYKGYEIRYIKGLATLRDYEYAEVLNREDQWICVEIDDPECLKIMYSPDVEPRKKLMAY